MDTCCWCILMILPILVANIADFLLFSSPRFRSSRFYELSRVKWGGAQRVKNKEKPKTQRCREWTKFKRKTTERRNRGWDRASINKSTHLSPWACCKGHWVTGVFVPAPSLTQSRQAAYPQPTTVCFSNSVNKAQALALSV